MREDVPVGTTRFFQGVSKNAEALGIEVSGR
jgi:hypothetical protein